jgi:hypothetical protein
LVEIGDSGALAFERDGRSVPVSPLALRIVWPRDRRGFDCRSLDDVQLLCNILAVDPAIVHNLIDEVNKDADSTVHNIRVVHDNGRATLLADVEGTARGLSFHNLSSSEQERITIELSIAFCRAIGNHQATVLVLDPCMAGMDARWFERVSVRLSDARNPFQTIAVVPTRKFDTAKLRWLGWEIIRTTGRPPAVSFDQTTPWPDPNASNAAPR